MYFYLLSKSYSVLAIDTNDTLQTNPKKYVVNTSWQYGFIIIHRNTIQHFAQSHFSVFQTSILKQTTGNKAWQNLYHKPRVGVNLIYTNFAGNKLLQSAFGVQFYIDFCKNYNKKNSLHFNLGCGVGYIQNPFDKNKNFKNIAIGTHFNGLVQVGLYYQIKLNKKFSLAAGASIIHFSNGAIKVPNLGINIANAGLALKFTNKSNHFAKVVQAIDTAKHYKYFELILSTGIKQNYPPSSSSFGVMALRTQYYFYNHQKYNVSSGVDLFYDNGLYQKLSEQNSKNANSKTALQVGINVQYQQNISKISIPIFMGVYAYNNYKGNGFLYHGIGIKYRVNKHLSASVILKSHYAKADYFLWGINYFIK